MRHKGQVAGNVALLHVQYLFACIWLTSTTFGLPTGASSESQLKIRAAAMTKMLFEERNRLLRSDVGNKGVGHDVCERRYLRDIEGEVCGCAGEARSVGRMS